jgi:hypothetical protein
MLRVVLIIILVHTLTALPLEREVREICGGSDRLARAVVVIVWCYRLASVPLVAVHHWG